MQDGKILSGSLFGYKKSAVNAYLLELDAKTKEKVDVARKKAETLQKENNKLSDAIKAKDAEIIKLQAEAKALREALDKERKQKKETSQKQKSGTLSARFKKPKQEDSEHA